MRDITYNTAHKSPKKIPIGIVKEAKMSESKQNPGKSVQAKISPSELSIQYDNFPASQKVYVEGSLRTRKWQDKQGQDRYSTEVVASTLNMLDSRTIESLLATVTLAGSATRVSNCSIIPSAESLAGA